jgi:hypothetical protein
VDVFSELSRLGALIRQLQGALQGNRVVSGTIIGTATPSITITAGSGFAAVRNGAGDYSVTFSKAFAATPAVVVGMGATGAVLWAKVSALGGATTAGFRVAIITPGGVATDGEAHFTAIGP